MESKALQFAHAVLATRNLKRWQSSELLTELEMTSESAAYSTLENAGVLWRHDPNHTALHQLTSLAPTVRRQLVVEACHYASDFSLSASLQQLLKKDCLEQEEIERFEHIFEQIDSLEAATDLAVALTDEFVDNDAELLQALCQNRQRVAALLEEFHERSDIAEVASRVLLVQRDPVYLPDGRPADWFTELRYKDVRSDYLATLLRDMRHAVLNHPQACP